jgi:hypothetical protein
MWKLYLSTQESSKPRDFTQISLKRWIRLMFIENWESVCVCGYSRRKGGLGLGFYFFFINNYKGIWLVAQVIGY